MRQLSTKKKGKEKFEEKKNFHIAGREKKNVCAGKMADFLSCIEREEKLFFWELKIVSKLTLRYIDNAQII